MRRCRLHFARIDCSESLRVKVFVLSGPLQPLLFRKNVFALKNLISLCETKQDISPLAVQHIAQVSTDARE